MKIIIASIIASLFVPEGTVKQIETSPLKRGEAAYVQRNDHEATAYIGSDGATALNVIDETALRGYEYKYVDRSNFIVTSVTNLTYSPTTDTMVSGTVTPGVQVAFRFEIPSDIYFDDVEVEGVARSTVSFAIEHLFFTRIRDGNTVTVRTETKTLALSKITIGDFKVRQIAYGDPSFVNDLTKKMINIRDTEGEMTLGNWRRWARHLYDGNRGADWADYDATSGVRVGGHGVAYGGMNRGLPQFAFGLDHGDTNGVAALVGGRYAVRYYTEGGDALQANAGVFISSILVDEETVTIGVTNRNVSGFSTGKIHLLYSDRFGRRDAAWREIPFTASIAGNVITLVASRSGGNEGYYRILYGNSHVVVHVTDTLKADRLLLRGDNGNFYRISVNSSGVLTASPIP